jgi:hypothetical protein
VVDLFDVDDLPAPLVARCRQDQAVAHGPRLTPSDQSWACVGDLVRAGHSDAEILTGLMLVHPPTLDRIERKGWAHIERDVLRMTVVRRAELAEPAPTSQVGALTTAVILACFDRTSWREDFLGARPRNQVQWFLSAVVVEAWSCQSSYLAVSAFQARLRDKAGRLWDTAYIQRQLQAVEDEGWITVVRQGRTRKGGEKNRANEFYPRWPDRDDR